MQCLSMNRLYTIFVLLCVNVMFFVNTHTAYYYYCPFSFSLCDQCLLCQLLLMSTMCTFLFICYIGIISYHFASFDFSFLGCFQAFLACFMAFLTISDMISTVPNSILGHFVSFHSMWFFVSWHFHMFPALFLAFLFLVWYPLSWLGFWLFWIISLHVSFHFMAISRHFWSISWSFPPFLVWNLLF